MQNKYLFSGYTCNDETGDDVLYIIFGNFKFLVAERHFELFISILNYNKKKTKIIQ